MYERPHASEAGLVRTDIDIYIYIIYIYIYIYIIYPGRLEALVSADLVKSSNSFRDPHIPVKSAPLKIEKDQ